MRWCTWSTYGELELCFVGRKPAPASLLLTRVWAFLYLEVCRVNSPWSSSGLPRKMEMAEEEDIKFITDEKFDFGLSSPSDSREEEVRHVERGVAQGLDLNVQQREDTGRSRECLARWSPLSAEKLEEIVKEANWLAVQLERCSLREKENARAGLLGDTALGPAGEPLVSMRLPHKERASPRSPRRETFVVKNSPVRALLPTVEPGTLLPPGKSPSPCARAAPTPPRLRHKLGSCSAGGERLRKKSTPSKGPALSPTKRTEKVDGPLRGGAEPPGPAAQLCIACPGEERTNGPQAISLPAPPCTRALDAPQESGAPPESKCRPRPSADGPSRKQAAATPGGDLAQVSEVKLSHCVVCEPYGSRAADQSNPCELFAPGLAPPAGFLRNCTDASGARLPLSAWGCSLH
ncbi:Proline/serine-rich coiled-coil protein 1 [Chelonia mydas]|uniref:Proline/serine-rich coiled-coil protein 1 n=1 Tax=Chelonia mydas TaxID=8469 RepID=M7AL42_CHEMY|nr:Proline/serine-rich coiled-coil protein 1 [Chelonia mydas]